MACSAVCNSDLSATLKLSQSEGEKWIVNLIRETRMGADAKIDLEKVPHSSVQSSGAFVHVALTASLP
jgi:hypothetical protein